MNELIRLTEIEARRLTDEVKSDAQKLWAKLLHLYKSGAHTALGYSSWAAYCEQEFNIGKTRAHRLLQAARVINELPIGNSLVPESEAIARELVPLLGDPQALDEAWNKAVEAADGGVPTAQTVREVVSRMCALPHPEKKPLHDLEGIDPNLFKLVVGHRPSLTGNSTGKLTGKAWRACAVGRAFPQGSF